MELKFKDDAVNLANITAVDQAFVVVNPDTTTTCLSGVAQGDGESNRDGRKYTIWSLFMRIEIVQGLISGSVQALDCAVRVIVFIDKATHGTVVNPLDVIQLTTIGSQVSGHINLHNTERFEILLDKWWRCNMGDRSFPNSNLTVWASSGYETKPFDFEVNFPHGLEVISVGVDGDIGNITNNSIQVIAGTTNLGFLSYQSRIRFTG